MPRSPLPSSRRHVMIFDEDWEYLEAQFGRPYGTRPIGTSRAIQNLVHRFVSKLKAKEEEILEENGNGR